MGTGHKTYERKLKIHIHDHLKRFPAMIASGVTLAILQRGGGDLSHLPKANVKMLNFRV